MKTVKLDLAQMRELLLEVLPPVTDQAGLDPDRDPRFMYAPPGHIRALDPDVPIVVGIRGAGKSYWWAALHSPTHRTHLQKFFSELKIDESVGISQGYGAASNPKSWPGSDIIRNISAKFDARYLWQAVIGTQLGLNEPFPTNESWGKKVEWIKGNPEDFESLLYQKDQSLVAEKKSHIVLFDALDRLADDWKGIRFLSRELFRLTLEMRSMKAIRIKLFVRPDMLEDHEIISFPDASKLLNNKSDLRWNKTDLYALFFHLAINASNSLFRDFCADKFSLPLTGSTDAGWGLPRKLRMEEEAQKSFFHTLSGEFMGGGKNPQKRGYPYSWTVNHLQDAWEQVSPRSFLAALRVAVEDESSQEKELVMDYRGIQKGVQKASEIRVSEITKEDYPWVQVFLSPLRNRISVPCEKNEITRIWKEEATLEKYDRESSHSTQGIKLPPAHREMGEEGILKDLIDIGIIQKMHNGRIQMPDVYRIGFGIKRRGGVKPLR